MQPTTITTFNPLLQKDWDTHAEKFSQFGAFHRSAWLRTLNQTYGYAPLAIRLDEGEQIKAAIVLMEVTSWLTGKRGISLPFSDHCPPLGDDPRHTRLIIEGLKQIGREKKWKYLELRGGGQHVDATPSSTYLNHILRLESSTEASLFTRFSGSNRRAIRKAEKSNLTISCQPTETALEKFYFLVQLSRKRLGVPPQPFSFFENILEYVVKPGHGRLILAELKGQPIAGALFLHCGKKALFKFGASDKRYQSLRGNNLVMWNAIQTYLQDGFQELDFGRTSEGNTGLRKFKLGWGTDETSISYFRYNFVNSSWSTSQDQSSGWHTHVFRLLPIPILKTVGALIYKHIA